MCIRDRDRAGRPDGRRSSWADRETGGNPGGTRVEEVILGLNPTVEGDGTSMYLACLLYTSDAADERSSVDLGGRRIIKKKKKK